MPLEHSSSPAAFKRNVSTLMGEIGKSPHVQSRDQALAIAYATKRRGRADGGIAPDDVSPDYNWSPNERVNTSFFQVGGNQKPEDTVSITPNHMTPSQGGDMLAGMLARTKDNPVSQGLWSGVAGYDAGGGVSDPVNAVISALQQGSSGNGSPMPAPGMSNPMAPSSAAATANTAMATGVVPPAPMSNAPATAMPVPQINQSAAGTNVNGPVAKMAGGGGFNMSQGPSLTAPWTERMEARGLHVGPVLSNVPGRTDNHQVKVPAGSYVLPAQHIASLGHGNTNAGMSIASKMFSGPYGMGGMSMGHGPGAPKPPKALTSFSEGGARGTDSGTELVPVNISGGEFVIHPNAIIRRFGNLKRGHAILDKWIMDTRKKEIETQKNLPPPAKK
jgi:hypothetical protein